MFENQNNQLEKANDRAMGWSDSIELDSQELAIIEGEYVFEIIDLERGHFPGSTKLTPCNKVTLTLEVTTNDGNKVTCRTDLLLHRDLEWKLSALFRSIGHKKPGERMTMDWNRVIGSRGRAIFKPVTYTNKYGEERTINSVERFLDYNANLMPQNGPFTDLPDNFNLPF